MVEIYYNSLQFGKTLEHLIPAFLQPLRFLKAWLSIMEKGSRARKSSRVRKYELLLDFAAEYFPEEKDRYRELLTVDYYLRERAKARPPLRRMRLPIRKSSGESAAGAGGDPCGSADRRRSGAAAGRKGRGRRNRGPVYLIFDYEKRSPLTGDAGLSWWEEEPKR